MKVYHIEFAKTGGGLSGGEKCMIEIIKYFKKKKIFNFLLTTDNGKQVYTELGLLEDQYLEYVIINSAWSEKKLHLFISYILRIFYFYKIKNQIIETVDRENDILMSHSDFFPNMIPTKILSKYFDKKAYYWFHMLCPDILNGYKGHFTKRIFFPSIRVIHYKLNQILFAILSRGGVLITVNPYYKSIFKDKNVYENFSQMQFV